jgi:branched-chain amino acid transport system substrate-binding protein
MAKKTEIPALILALATTLLLLGGGFWVVSRYTQFGRSLSGSLSEPGSGPSQPNQPNQPNQGGQPQLAERFSAGDRLLISSVTSPNKEAGIAAFAAGDYAGAEQALAAALAQNRNDPEALIYLNNARVANQPNLKVAVAVPASAAVDSAQEILRGVAQAQQQVNAGGGVNGVPLWVEIASDDNDPQVAAEVAEAWIKDPSVLGVIGHFGSDTSLAAGQVYQQGNLVMISPTSTSTRLSGFGNYVFRTVPSDRFTATTLSRYLIDTAQQPNVAIYFNADSDYSQSLKQELTTAIYSDGGQVVAEVNVAEPGFNAQASLEQAVGQGAEAVVLATNTATLDQALQVIAANQTGLLLLGGDSLYNPKLLQQGGAAADGMIVTVPWIFLSNPNSAFASQARQLWGGDVNWRTAMAYDAFVAIATGLSPNANRQGLQATLTSGGFSAQGATGAVRFLPSGDRNQAMQLVEVAPGQRSGYGYDFVPVRP